MLWRYAVRGDWMLLNLNTADYGHQSLYQRKIDEIANERLIATGSAKQQRNI